MNTMNRYKAYESIGAVGLLGSFFGILTMPVWFPYDLMMTIGPANLVIGWIALAVLSGIALAIGNEHHRASVEST